MTIEYEEYMFSVVGSDRDTLIRSIKVKRHAVVATSPMDHRPTIFNLKILSAWLTSVPLIVEHGLVLVRSTTFDFLV